MQTARENSASSATRGTDHLGHQRSLIDALEPYADFYWLRQYKRPFDKGTRGEFPVEMVTHYEPGKYDLAILHLDQQCFEAKDIWDVGKGRLYRDLNEKIQDIPKIVINHGTPYWPEEWSSDLPDGCSTALVERMKKAVGENTMVVNSRTAAKQWGFGTPIIHGLDPKDWWDLPKERRVVTMISPGGLDMYYDRQFLASVKEILQDEDIMLCHITVDWQAKDWDDYRQFLGRSLVYFNPTRQSPMPRSRTEAMLSGCCVITTGNQDASDFIESGVNGFITPRNPQRAAELIKWCLNNYDQALAIGQKGKQTVLELSSMSRYQRDWVELLSKVLKRDITQ